ncbi:hypothetical protein KIN20_032463 [Parelaphostrongylus tenuis]|uniref:Uncharacterized protein n=1 Tax=Parelaphostrongylus tenuis TaxID=148309 RepID=A0AAD5R6R5_PARTN|nr:hypothetical protein KIN20_032463 [Parelaphostrongylus tenuis]
MTEGYGMNGEKQFCLCYLCVPETESKWPERFYNSKSDGKITKDTQLDTQIQDLLLCTLRKPGHYISRSTAVSGTDHSHTATSQDCTPDNLAATNSSSEGATQWLVKQCIKKECHKQDAGSFHFPTISSNQSAELLGTLYLCYHPDSREDHLVQHSTAFIKKMKFSYKN